MIFDVRHLTEIQYAAPVRLARFNLRLKPAPWPGQKLDDYRLMVSPDPASVVTSAGPYVVNHSRLAMAQPITQLRIESCFTIEVTRGRAPDDDAAPALSAIRAAALDYRDLSGVAPPSYLFPSPIAKLEPEIGGWAHRFFAAEKTVVAAGRALMQAIFAEFDYDGNATKTDTPPIEAFRKRHGVCQDFAHIMVIAARAHAIPAAYVSGYLRTIPPHGSARLIGADATHAWANLWCGPELGWIGFDPTNNMIVENDHIFTAMGRDYGDVAPVDGVFLGGEGQEMQVSVDVNPIG